MAMFNSYVTVVYQRVIKTQKKTNSFSSKSPSQPASAHLVSVGPRGHPAACARTLEKTIAFKPFLFGCNWVYIYIYHGISFYVDIDIT